MSTLTGQQIKDTYDGLLKLNDSTNGITANLQSITDGLGNNTGSRIATNYLTAPNVVSVDANIKPDYMGTGVSTTAGSAMNASAFNKIQYNIFYDTGVHSYSAVTYGMSLATSTSDVVGFSIYSLQFVPTIGVAPKNLIMSGITWDSTGGTGIKTTPLPSTLSFSGTGGGFYVYALYVQNSGVAPTVRYNAGLTSRNTNGYMESVGYVMNTPGNGIVLGSRVGLTAPGVGMLLNLPPQVSYTENDIITYQVSTQITGMAGIALNVIR